jgi:hypothetical protein
MEQSKGTPVEKKCNGKITGTPYYSSPAVGVAILQ